MATKDRAQGATRTGWVHGCTSRQGWGASRGVGRTHTIVTSKHLRAPSISIPATERMLTC
jgi:hypothetical protein